MGVVHRDLKPENMLLDANMQTVKLIDFGMSKILTDPNAIMDSKLGTPYYISPEILTGKYDKGCDMWAIGVVSFVLLSGQAPFYADNTAALFRKIKSCDYEFEHENWDDVSRDAKRFIEALIEPNTKKRLTVEQALAHPWITSMHDTGVIVDSASAEVFARLKKFGSPKRLRMMILMMLVQLIDPEILKENRRAFHCIDTDHSGTVSQAEMLEAIGHINNQFHHVLLSTADV